LSKGRDLKENNLLPHDGEAILIHDKGYRWLAHDFVEELTGQRRSSVIDIATLPAQEEVYSERTSVFFKHTHVFRILDKKRNTLVYVALSEPPVESFPGRKVALVGGELLNRLAYQPPPVARRSRWGGKIQSFHSELQCHLPTPQPVSQLFRRPGFLPVGVEKLFGGSMPQRRIFAAMPMRPRRHARHGQFATEYSCRFHLPRHGAQARHRCP
jgi:hypothetical protein